MAIPKCKLNAWNPQFGEYIAEEQAIRDGYADVDCEGNDYDTDVAIIRLLGDKEKLFNINQLGK